MMQLSRSAADLVRGCFHLLLLVLDCSLLPTMLGAMVAFRPLMRRLTAMMSCGGCLVLDSRAQGAMGLMRWHTGDLNVDRKVSYETL